jgi:cell division protein FtsB
MNRVNASAKSYSSAKKPFRMHRLFDGIVLAVILAACGICVSYYLRSRAEFSAALSKHQVATEKLDGVTNEVEKLEWDVRRLKTDVKTFEELARHKFGFVGADDVVIKLAQSETEALNSARVREVQMANLTPKSPTGYTDYSHKR